MWYARDVAVDDVGERERLGDQVDWKNERVFVKSSDRV